MMEENIFIDHMFNSHIENRFAHKINISDF